MRTRLLRSARLIAACCVIALTFGGLGARDARADAIRTSRLLSAYERPLGGARSTIESLIQRAGIPGLAITVAIDGKVVWSRGYGYADLQNPIAATPRTPMRIGSISKSITAAALARLADAGRIDLSSSVRAVLPDLPEADQMITLKELGGHVGGIRTYRSPSEKTVYQHYESVSQALAIFANDPLANTPGAKFLYTSYGFVLLSAAAERATGQSFAEVLRQNVLTPLAMTGTMADDVDQIIRGRAGQYEMDAQGHAVNAPYSDDSYKLAGSGMLSTSDDLAALGRALVGEDFLSPGSRALLFTSQTLTSGESTGYGLGWFVDMPEFLSAHRSEMPASLYEHLAQISAGRQLIWHSGTANGATAMLLLVPETTVVVAIVCNLGGVEPQLIAAAMEVEAPLSRARPGELHK